MGQILEVNLNVIDFVTQEQFQIKFMWVKILR